jgi:PIN domain nuclease of toxin-antitoxin system
MILLDTHIWINWILLGPDALKPAIASAIEAADRVVVSAISCFEVTLLVKGRKLELPLSTDEWIKEALEQGGQRFSSHHIDEFILLVL